MSRSTQQARIRVFTGPYLSALERHAGNERGCGRWDNGSLMSFVASAGRRSSPSSTRTGTAQTC